MKTKLNGILTLFLVLVVQVAFAQQTVTGKVVDAGGEPILGATVIVSGSQNATTTDFDGNYSIEANPSDNLEFSFSGYDKKVIRVGTENVINVTLSTSLDAVIVTTYRTSKKTKSNVAASVVTSETIENRPNASFVQTLEGQVAGLNIFTTSGQPGANSNVQLRGVGSLNGNTEPLFLLDGAPIDEDNFRSLNPQDIESVTVLKDAGATAIYGNRGSNGVIVITTKQGNFNQALRINATSILSFTSLQDNDYDVMNSQELLTLERERGLGYGAGGGRDDNGFFDAGVPLTDAQIAAFPNTDWTDVFFRTGITKNTTLSLSSGGENSRQFTSFGYFDQEGILVQSDLKRFNFRNNVSGKSENERFTYDTNFTANYSVSNEPNSIGSGAINRNYVLAAYQSVPYISPDSYTTGANILARPGGLRFAETPLFLLDRLATYDRKEEELKLIGSASFSYELTDWLTAKSVSSIDYQSINLARAEQSQSFNSLLFQNANNAGVAGFQQLASRRQLLFNQTTSLNFNKTFNEKHTVYLGLFTEYFKGHFRGLDTFIEGLDPRTFALGDGSGIIRDNGASDVFVDTVDADVNNVGLFSYFGLADYDYDNRYGLGLSLRRDASSRFAESNRWGTFYSVSARWNISNEEFWGDDNPVNVLKLRGSYGTTGNQFISLNNDFGIFGATANFLALDLVNDRFNTGGGYRGSQAVVPSVFGVSDLRWETSKQWNVGIDYEAFNSRLRGSLDFYYEDTEDLFQSRPISGTVGTGGYALDANFGLLTNKGVEFEVRYNVIQPASRGDFSLEVFGVGALNENVIRDIPAEEGFVINGTTGLREGGRINEYYLLRYAGVNPANGNVLFLTADGDVTETPNADTDRVWLDKNITPEFQGSFGLNLDYQGFFVETQFQYATGIDRFDNDLAGFQDPTNLGQFNVSRDLFRAWTPDNRVTDIPSLDATNINTFTSDRYLVESDFLRLRFVSLGYNFGKPVLEKVNLNNLRVFVNAENLVTFSKFRGFDAAATTNGSRLYPTPRIISFGVEVGI